MALTRTKNNGKKYDEKECWDLYMSWGAAATVEKLHRWHKEYKGFGSHMGGIWAMWRYAAQNPDACYPQFKQWYFESASAIADEVVDPNITFDDFLNEIRVHAKNKNSIMSQKKYKQFCQKWNLNE